LIFNAISVLIPFMESKKKLPVIKQAAYRSELKDGDHDSVREIILSSGMFYDYEVDVAVELVDERAAKGISSGYYFIFAEIEGRTVGYTCYGPIACTKNSYDLYWIAVHDSLRGRGLGKLLLRETEKEIAAMGGGRIYIETSDKPDYDPTRRFYLSCGYTAEALLKDFYGPNDSKVVYVKVAG
jgi:GNAT superfamily N-acetyltransferase